MLKSIRIILEIILYYVYKIKQINVNTNILNGDLEDVYIMTQTNSFVHPKISRKIFRLWKFICELKQTSWGRDIRF